MIKNIILFTGILILSVSCAPLKGKFEIRGNVEGIADENVYVLHVANNLVDTLCKGMMQDGQFELTGELDSVTIAYLKIGKGRGERIILEKGNFQVEGDSKHLKISGENHQELYNRFQEVGVLITDDMYDLEEKYYNFEKQKDSAGMERVWNEMENLIKEYHIRENELIRENPNSMVSAFIICYAMTMLDIPSYMKVSLIDPVCYEQIKDKYLLLGEQGKKTFYGKIVGDYIKAREQVAVGAVAPDFTMKTPEGKNVSLYSIKGKVKLVDFWASWCGPCRAENPNVVKMYKRFHDKGLEIVGVSLDDNQEKWENAIQEDGLVWIHISDLKGWKSPIVTLYQVCGIPATFLLDEDNRIVAKNLRGEELEKAIEKLLE